MTRSAQIGSWLLLVIGLLYLLNGMGVQEVSFMNNLNGFAVLFIAWGMGSLLWLHHHCDDCNMPKKKRK